MRQENVDVVRGIYDAFGRGDIPKVLDALDPQVEWTEAENLQYAEGNPYIGRDAVLQGIFMRLAAEWDRFVVSPQQIIDGGERVVAVGRYGGTYKPSGESIDAQFVHVMTFRDGKIARFEQFTDTAQFARAMAGAGKKVTA